MRLRQLCESDNEITLSGKNGSNGLFTEFDFEKIPKGTIVNVNGSVALIGYKGHQLPVQFGVVSGWFDCSNSDLSTLEGSPKEVMGGSFNCSGTKITSLKHSPIFCKQFVCSNNPQLSSLVGGPIIVGDEYRASNTGIKNLDGFPRKFEKSSLGAAVHLLGCSHLESGLLKLITTTWISHINLSFGSNNKDQEQVVNLVHQYSGRGINKLTINPFIKKMEEEGLSSFI